MYLIISRLVGNSKRRISRFQRKEKKLKRGG